MPLTRTEARDCIFALVKAVGDVLVDEQKLSKLIWDDKPDSRPKEAERLAWARVSLVHTSGEVASINPANVSGGAGPAKRRRYNRTGILTVQIFVPSGDGLELADEISSRMEAALQGKNDAEAVAFRSVFSQEIGIDGPWHQTNTVATFEYDEFA